MRFWDTSALVPLVVDQSWAPAARTLAARDPAITIWWGTIVEAEAAIARLERERIVSAYELPGIRDDLAELITAANVIEPSDSLRAVAVQLVRRHVLRAADALQLAAALAWAGGTAGHATCVSFDHQLRRASLTEGFRVEPEL